MTSPLSKGVVQRAIAQSGTEIDPEMPSLDQSEQTGANFVAKVKARYGEDAITFLRQLSAQDLMKSLPNNIGDRLPS